MNKMTKRSGRDQSRLINLYLLTKIIGQDVKEAKTPVIDDDNNELAGFILLLLILRLFLEFFKG